MHLNADQRAVVRACQALIDQGEWVALDTETTSLTGEVIQCAVCDPHGTLLYQSLIKPTIAISEQARSFHHISDKMVEKAPFFPSVWVHLRRLLEGQEVVFYNSEFDLARVVTSLSAHTESIPSVKDEIAWLHDLKVHCAMHWFAVIYGEWNDWKQCYKSKKLVEACAFFGIPFTPHSAEADAWATAQLVQAMAKVEIPDNVLETTKDIPAELEDLPF